MSVASEITRIKNNIASAYTAVSNKGGTLPQTQNSANLATAINSISTGSSANLGTKTITSNGTYNASSDSLDGYSSVTVNVPTATITDARYLCAYGRVSQYNELFAMCSGITSSSYFFYYANNVANLDFSKFNIFNITDMSYMFSRSKFSSLNLSNLNTSKVTNMSYMFSYITTLTDLDLSNFDTSEVTNMGYMFYGSTNLATLDLSNFDFSKVTNYNRIFNSCGTNNSTPTTVYVKDSTAQQWILNLSTTNRPSDWSTDNVIIKGS